MSTEPPAEAATSPPPRRRLRAVLLLATLAGVAIAGLLVDRAMTAEHLSTGNGMNRFPGEPVDDPFDDEERVVEVAYRHGAEYSFDFTLTNDSRWAVRVLGFPRSRGESLLRQVGVDMDTTPFEEATETFVRFRPFTLKGGGEAVIRVHSRFANCEHYGPGSSATITAVAIRSRVLWATRTHFVDLPTGVQVAAPPAGSCPAR